MQIHLSFTWNYLSSTAFQIFNSELLRYFVYLNLAWVTFQLEALPLLVCLLMCSMAALPVSTSSSPENVQRLSNFIDTCITTASTFIANFGKNPQNQSEPLFCDKEYFVKISEGFNDQNLLLQNTVFSRKMTTMLAECLRSLTSWPQV